MKKKLSIILATGFSTIALAGAVAASAVTLTSCSEVTYLSNENLTNMYKGISESGLFTNITKPELTGDETMVKALDNYFNNKKDASAEAKAVAADDAPAGPTGQGGQAGQAGQGAVGNATKLSVQEQLINKAAEAAQVPANAIQAVVVKVSEKKTEQQKTKANDPQPAPAQTPSYQAEIAIQFGDADVSNLTKNDGFTLSPNRSEATFTTPIAITFADSSEAAPVPPSEEGGKPGQGGAPSVDGKISLSTIDVNTIFTSLDVPLNSVPAGTTDYETYFNTTNNSALLDAVKDSVQGLNGNGVVKSVQVSDVTGPTMADGAQTNPGTLTVTVIFGENKVTLPTIEQDKNPNISAPNANELVKIGLNFGIKQS